MNYVFLFAISALSLAGCSWMGNSDHHAAAPAPAAVAPLDSGIAQSSHSDADTKAVQAKLGVRPDGVWGPASERAMRTYQQNHNLSVTGTANAETMAQMNIARPDRAPESTIAPTMGSPCKYEAPRTDGSCPDDHSQPVRN